jgi:hypothetical protein
MIEETRLTIRFADVEEDGPSIICTGTMILTFKDFHVIMRDDLEARRMLPKDSSLDVICESDKITLIARVTDTCKLESHAMWPNVAEIIDVSQPYPFILEIGNMVFFITAEIFQPKTIYYSKMRRKTTRGSGWNPLRRIFPWLSRTDGTRR